MVKNTPSLVVYYFDANINVIKDNNVEIELHLFIIIRKKFGKQHDNLVAV